MFLEDRVYNLLASTDMVRRTGHVATKLGITTSHARRILRKLEQQGRVKINKRYSFPNDYYWDAIS